MQGVTLRRAGRRIWRKRQLYFLLLPALVSVAIFHLYSHLRRADCV